MIYEVRACGSDGKVRSFGARRVRAEAEQVLAQAIERVASAGGRNDRYWIEEIDTEGLFEIPPLPKPRDRYTTRVTARKKPGSWATSHVEVLDGDTVIAAYDRNYSMLGTFEPFRQDDRDFALISPHYTATSVMDLATGEIIAAEQQDAGGFCPVGFYVPDWHDIHDGTILPGSMQWRPADHEWPCGDFGFVWGCIWGDDSAWKVQYLDLSGIRRGELRRDDRFGYVRLATRPGVPASEFIRCASWQGRRSVELVVEQSYDLGTGDRADLDPFG